MDILNGTLKDSKRDIVLLNSGAVFVVDGKARDIQDGIEMAKEAIESKKAINHLEKIIKISNSF